MANASSYGKLSDLTKEKEETEALLEQKMERWEYLTELAEKIEAPKKLKNSCFFEKSVL